MSAAICYCWDISAERRVIMTPSLSYSCNSSVVARNRSNRNASHPQWLSIFLLTPRYNNGLHKLIFSYLLIAAP